jgi:hypothetical protein
MGRSPELDAILEAWLKTEYCAKNERAQYLAILEGLLQKAAEKLGNEVTPYQIRTAIYERYKAFKAERFKLNPVQIAQSALKPGSQTQTPGDNPKV